MYDIQPTLTRRRVLATAGGAALAGLTAGIPLAHADTRRVREVLQARFGDKRIQAGRITLEMPQLAEDGHTVPLSCTVESPMTPEDYVQAIHVLATKNPWPEVATFHLTPRSGRAEVDVRIRLAMTQDVIAVAEMSDGSAYMTTHFIKVLISGCSI